MPVNRQWVRTFLQQFDFESLFIEELGWDTVDLNVIPVGIDDEPYQAQAIAQKRGMVVYHCQSENGGNIPGNSTRRKIDHQINQYTREHLIIYSDEAQQNQIWQWVRREKGKPLAAREYQYHINQDGESLVQKLEALAIDLDEEEALTLTEVTKRTRKAFDVDKVTKRFYDRFKKEHGRFLDFINGIQEQFDQEWYCSIMLNRLMFVYFMQKKGFLDGDSDYLRNRLNTCQQNQGNDEFYSFYRYFLLRLFHEGLGSPDRDDPTLESLIGKIPYLNGGLFDVHELEERYPEIQVPDEAFEAIFNFFDEYQWHLDDRPLRNDKEINPDVLGYIFEKYINQKQMGAYYTKEDITDYIGKNTIIPYLFDAAKKECAIAFEPNGEVWQLLRDNPNRYIYDAVQRGVDLELPKEIAAGIEDVSKRDTWNRFAEPDYALPTELWREHVARRQRCLEVRKKLSTGEIHEINELITYNLDIRQFAQDVIEQCEGPELLRGFYKAISQISILDPTCGSGAFLFAALNILEPLYEACLDRMQGFVDDLNRSADKPHPEKFKDFRQILEQAAKHPNRQYFILKSIILGNLYGVDIMEEAVEICKLRLFLKLVSQVNAKSDKPNYGLEPLPDIDFNIRAGNTLVGFSTYDEVKKAVEGDDQQKLDLFSDMQRIDESAEIADRAFQMFRKQQTELGMNASQFKAAKIEVKQRLGELNNELNRYLVREYGINIQKPKLVKEWVETHQPFHWFVEYYRIMKCGGFDIIIGNPPYVEYKKTKVGYKIRGYSTEKCGNLWAFVLERATLLLGNKRRISLIVPLSLVSASKMRPALNYLDTQSDYCSLLSLSGDAHPSVLFDGVKMSYVIFTHKISRYNPERNIFSSKLYRWLSKERKHLFSIIEYIDSPTIRPFDLSPKIGSNTGKIVFEKICSKARKVHENSIKKSDYKILYHRIVRHFVKSLIKTPYFFNERDGEKKSEDYKEIYFQDLESSQIARSILVSSIFYYFFISLSDSYHCGRKLVLEFPIDILEIKEYGARELIGIGEKYEESLFENAQRREIRYRATGLTKYDEFYPRLSKYIADEIDFILGSYYSLDDYELDFIINYDIKYRMGLDNM
ncbi:DNA methyltransferase [Leptothoe sp. ISB3NOV94-8A]